MSVDDQTVWNATGDGKDVQVVDSTTSSPNTVAGIPCSDTWFFLAIYGPLYCLVCVLGFIGNSLSICVLRAGGSRHQTVSTYLLKALAVSRNTLDCDQSNV